MNALSIQLSDSIYHLKEKLTDKEYMDLMELVKKCNVEDNKQKLYKITFIFPRIDTTSNRCEEHPREYIGTTHNVHLSKETVVTKITICKEQDDLPVNDWCRRCKNEDGKECMYKELFLDTIDNFAYLNDIQLISIFDKPVQQLIKRIRRTLFQHNRISCIEVIRDDDGEIKDVIQVENTFNMFIYFISVEEI